MHFQHLARIKALAETIPVVSLSNITSHIYDTPVPQTYIHLGKVYIHLYTPWKAAAMNDFHGKSSKKT